jgi:biopolymer transport protein TolR
MPKLEPMTYGQGGRRRARAVRVSSSLAEINVVPLVDVMLVLLVIFMVAAPMMQEGYPVNLPQAQRAQPLEHEPVVLAIPSSFHRDHKVRLGNDAVPLSTLSERVKQVLEGQLSRGILLAPDADITSQELVEVFDRLQQAGVEKIGFQTQPLKTGRVP